MKTNEDKIEKLLEKIEKSKTDRLDLSSNEDLSIAIMNLISIEEHFFFTAKKTGKDNYFDLLKEVREIRKELLKKIIPAYEGEVWCISKHLLASSMRLMEVGTKYLSEDKKAEAKGMFEKSYNLYNLFWAINLKLIELPDIKKIDSSAIDNKKTASNTTVFSKLGAVIKKAIDCCIE